MATTEKEKTLQGLSEKLYSKLTWKGDKPRVFQLIGTGTIDTFNADSERNIPGPEIKRRGSFPAETVIYDQFETGADKVKIIRNVTGRIRKQKENGEAFFEDVTAAVVFDNDGLCIVQPGEKNLLARLLFSDNNRTNTYRRILDGSGNVIPVFWEEVKDHTAEKQEIIRMAELTDFARSQVKSMPMDEVRSRLLTYNQNYNFSGKNSDELKYDLRLEAEKDPYWFLSNSSDESIKLGLIVDDAMGDGVLTHDRDTKSFAMEGKSFWTYSMENDEDPKGALIKYLISNKGKADKNNLLALVKQA